MRQIQVGILILVFVFIEGCAETPRLGDAFKTRNDLRDVFVLTILVQDYYRTSSGQDFDIGNLFHCDSLSRILNNFEEIQQTFRGGHIAIQYRFSKKRDPRIEFTEYESRKKENWKVIKRNMPGDFDGEIQFEYGERFYNFKKIIVYGKKGTVANSR